MKQHYWSTAKSLKKDVNPFWIGDFEIYFPKEKEEDDGPECFISEQLGDAMASAPLLEEAILKIFETHRLQLQGHSVRVQEGKLALYEGNSGDPLGCWSLPDD